MGRIGEKLSLSMYESVQAIKDRVTCFDVARYLGADENHGFVRCGSERTRSCHIRDNFFKCYSCGKHGDVIDFYCHETGADLKTAIRVLDRAFNIRILDTALDDFEAEKIRKERERRELRRAYAQFWERRSDLWRHLIISRLRTLELFYFRLKPKYRSQIENAENAFQLDLFLGLENTMKKYNEILDCLDEIQVETRLDQIYGFAYDKDMAKKRHWAVLKALEETDFGL